jgi:hypothetical protein
MTAPKPVEQVARDADAIGYVRGLNKAASWTRAFDQDLSGFDRPTCVDLAKGLTEMARHAGERLGVAIDYNEPPAPMFHDCCVHDGHGDRAGETDPAGGVLESAIAWLKRQRDEYRPATDAWIALDGALDGLRDHFYTGTPLSEPVQGPWAEVDR